MRLLSRALPPLLLSLGVAACGEDAEKQYAGLSVITVPGAVGYRLRYLAPPWSEVEKDPLATGEATAVPFGTSTRCSRTSDTCLNIVARSGRVLEIEKQSMSSPGVGVIVYPKYRLEVVVVSCDPAALAGKDVCADVLAGQEELARRSVDSQDDVLVARSGENDSGQPYRELLTQDRESGRYRRIVYFGSGDRTRSVRLSLEANPVLDEREVTRMVEAFEVLSTAGSSAADAGSAP